VNDPQSASGTARSGEVAGRVGSGLASGHLLSARLPAQALIEHLLDSVPRRGWLARLLGFSPLDKGDRRDWYKGVLGERQVAGRLARLDPAWVVLHSVPVGSGTSDIDHVVVGPGGVFTLNSKNHSAQDVWVAGRTFLVAGKQCPHIRNSEHEAARASKLLSRALGRAVPVTPLIVVVEPQRLTIKEPPAEVVVLTNQDVRRWLKRRRTVLTAQEVEQIVAVADRPGTWHTSPVAPLDRAELQSRLATLQREVRQARIVAGAWGFAVLGGVVLAAWLLRQEVAAWLTALLTL